MYKNLILILLLIHFTNSFCQEKEYVEIEETYESVDEVVEPVVQNTEEEEDYYYEEPDFYNDTITYNKTLDYEVKRAFDSDLKSKYNGSDFKYIEEKDEKEKSKKDQNTGIGINFLGGFGSFMTNVFPFLLGAIVVFILVRALIKTDKDFWKFNKSTKKTKENLFYEDDEDINKNDYEALLKKAIQRKEYRLATRYYYLLVLKKLSKKELIQYDKDKTNTEYQFELTDKQMRSKFAYLAYIYDYVWYGEFLIDENKFNTIDKNYKSFIKSI